MYKGIYVAMTGAMLRNQELDNVTQNMANANTAGYKRTSFSSRLYPLLEGVTDKQNAVYPGAKAMAYFGQSSIDTSDGVVQPTGNPLDLACRGDGFFAVQGVGNNIYYTRNGSFSRSKDGLLVDGTGQQVLDTANKPIRIIGSQIQVEGDGTIYADGNNSGKIKLVKLDPSTVQHMGNSLFSGTEAGTSGGQILEGAIEMSNVNPIKEMVGIISALREFEVAQKVITNFDTLAEKTVTEIAKV
ncbi:MAG TPA: flagellar hook basal-body protein [Dissulfurispiraceae bacterium]|nr:flagellar hook basal-body protein [Dissulfurispiraceae bacterium]